MDEQQGRHPEDDADDLLRRALIDPEASVAVALKVNGLALADALTVVFHGRADLGTIQTYVAHGRPARARRVAADALLRVPCDLDLGDAEDRDEAEEAYVEQARTLRDAIVAADTVLAIWREPLSELAEGNVAVEPLDRARRPPARAPADAGRARRARAPPDDRAGLRRAHAGRGPAADGHRLRPAGRRARVPAARRPGALPRGLRRAAPPTTRADGRAPRAPGGVGPALPGAQRRRRRAARAAGVAPRLPWPAGVAPCPHPARRRGRRSSFLAISFLLARWLNTEGQERGAVFALLQAQARGDAGAMLKRLDGCAARPACAATTRANARRLKRPGEVKILAYDSETAYALGTTRGPTRVAWTVSSAACRSCSASTSSAPGRSLAGRAVRLRRLERADRPAGPPAEPAPRRRRNAAATPVLTPCG